VPNLTWPGTEKRRKLSVSSRKEWTLFYTTSAAHKFQDFTIFRASKLTLQTVLE
jgi:hypothetical protein